jgi:hypothetical protein
MQEELKEIHQPTWTGQSCKDVLGRTITSNKCTGCLQNLELAKEIYQLIQINRSEKLEHCQITPKSTEIRIEAMICMLEENQEKQENDQKKNESNNLKDTDCK